MLMTFVVMNRHNDRGMTTTTPPSMPANVSAVDALALAAAPSFGDTAESVALDSIILATRFIVAVSTTNATKLLPSNNPHSNRTKASNNAFGL
jgi:hypothetical protein